MMRIIARILEYDCILLGNGEYHWMQPLHRKSKVSLKKKSKPYKNISMKEEASLKKKNHILTTSKLFKHCFNTNKEKAPPPGCQCMSKRWEVSLLQGFGKSHCLQTNCGKLCGRVQFPSFYRCWQYELVTNKLTRWQYFRVFKEWLVSPSSPSSIQLSVSKSLDKPPVLPWHCWQKSIIYVLHEQSVWYLTNAEIVVSLDIFL